MIAAGLLAGAGVGLALVLVAYGLAPRRTPLAVALADLLDPTPATGNTGVPGAASREQLARRVAGALTAAGADLGRLDADLRVVGRTLEDHLLDKVAAALAGLVLPPATVLLLRLGGAGVPLSAATVAALVLAAGGFVLPDALLRRQAAQRRRDFRWALSAYLTLAHILLAAGSGVETAVADAAEAGDGWAFERLRSALGRSRLGGHSPWAAFGRLGAELDLPDLREVASSLSLAGMHGARVRASLEARAAALRSRDLAEMEADAESATERMAVPSVLMVVGFVIFVGYPALAQILGF